MSGYGYYIIVDGMMLDINLLDIYMLTDQDIDSIAEESYFSDDLDEVAWAMHEVNRDNELRRISEISANED